MKSIFKILAISLVGAIGMLGIAAGNALAFNDEPLTDNWAPSEWGADDKVGAVNRTNPCIVMAAVKLVKKGKVATLGKVYQADAPFFGVRGWNMTIPGLPTGGPFYPGGLMYNDEMLTTEIGQVGTQFDGPGHIGVDTSKGFFFYNGRYLHDADVTTYGMGPLGVEHVAQIGFVCRGVLLDAAGYRGMDMLPVPKPYPNAGDPGIITDKDVKAIVKKQGIASIGEGDCVFIHTGHGNIWHPTLWDTYDKAEKLKRVAQFNGGEPGFGISACDYMASRKIILTGGDTWATEALAPDFTGETEIKLACHVQMMPKRGIWNMENLDLTKLVDDKAYEFLFVWSPLKMKGATGSPGNPVALW